MKLQRYDNNVYRVMNDGILTGMALKLANGRWGAFNPCEQKISDLTFASAKDVLAYFKLGRKALEEAE